jgi:hypothetical protein
MVLSTNAFIDVIYRRVYKTRVYTMVLVIDVSSSYHGCALATRVSNKGLLHTLVNTHQSLVREYHRRVFILSQ